MVSAPILSIYYVMKSIPCGFDRGRHVPWEGGTGSVYNPYLFLRNYNCKQAIVAQLRRHSPNTCQNTMS